MKWRVFSAVVSTCVIAFTHSAEAASASVRARMAFADPLQVTSSRNLQLPIVVSINNISTLGSLYIDRSGAVDSDQHHDFVNFMGPQDQLMNFLTLGHSLNSTGHAVPIKSICSLNGADKGCDKIYGSLKNDGKTMYTGMDTMYLSDLTPSASQNNRLLSFDLCAVYQ